MDYGQLIKGFNFVVLLPNLGTNQNFQAEETDDVFHLGKFAESKVENLHNNVEFVKLLHKVFEYHRY